jgi:hypothetical protein
MPPAVRSKRSLRRHEPVMDDRAEIGARICLLRGRLAIVDSELAAIYRVPVRRLEVLFDPWEPVPGEIRFGPEDHDLPHGHRSDPIPTYRHAFTEHGCFMAALLLNTKEAMAISVQLIRAFARMRADRHTPE